MPKQLATIGYKSAAFGSPEAIVSTNRLSLETAGFEFVLDFPPAERTGNEDKPGMSQYGTEQWMSRQLRLDHASLKSMLSRIREWHSNDERYVALFLPQIGHEPWMDTDPKRPEPDFWARGRKLLKLQDEWLGEIYRELSAAGRLDSTIIVVTGDHGLRLPGAPGVRRDESMMRDHTFRVPLLVHAPAALKSTLELKWPTSHIDVMPTVLDLLGVGGAREHEQGRAVWDPRLVDRSVYFFGSEYLGSDAYRTKDAYVSWDRRADIVYYNTELLFRPEHVQRDGTRAAREQAGKIASMAMILRYAWFHAPPEMAIASPPLGATRTAND